jgi:vancomycin permeability regulator SanA
MLQNASEQIRECLARAEACAQGPVFERNPQLRCGFSNLAQRW